MDCYVCERNGRVDELPPRERIAVDRHWRVAHAFNSSLPGWLVLVPRRHVTTVAALTDAEAAALGVWQVRLSRALGEVTGCARTYVAQFAEREGFGHVHFHVVPRMPDLPADHRGPAIFRYLTGPPSQVIDEPERDALAIALQTWLSRPKAACSLS
ncbi:diadenosine tetraphosphate (Ap4A) HIT family hydrolase [Catenuloplanes nepalensis]|uniref:Diadenosine tetraphosphate (Ap4A) HIT family hydrolase n=1 Tax=Catenuloplanes nepalensis TaxID=587533 RepID=A0ABT9MSE8_9ACTN|nr:HIT domain-containing protein [Catenuloplanes nepalensis]MDP9794363.1 diadenosine tetraphosphate (Ap4A) HIT family hydrolase [Catenuloplanes nepalensis]